MRLKKLQTESVKNDFIIKQEIQLQAHNISEEAKKVQANADLLGKRYRNVGESLTQRVTKNKDDIIRAKGLLQRASELTADTQSKFKDLEGMESVYKDNELALQKLMGDIDELNNNMTSLLIKFEESARKYREC